jgi:hypothetical protein
LSAIVMTAAEAKEAKMVGKYMGFLSAGKL